MHAHFAEVMSEARLHDGPCRGVEWLAGRAQDFVDKGWRFGPAQVAFAHPLHLQGTDLHVVFGQRCELFQRRLTYTS